MMLAPLEAASRKALTSGASQPTTEDLRAQAGWFASMSSLCLSIGQGRLEDIKRDELEMLSSNLKTVRGCLLDYSPAPPAPRAWSR